MEVNRDLETLQPSLSKAHQLQHRNALLPSTSLPPEILSYVFELVQTIYSCFGPKYRHAWVSVVTHVCTAWRQVALQTPQLWSSAPLYPLEWGNEVLQRAKGAPLDVSICDKLFGDDLSTMNEGLAFMKHVLNEPDRIRSLDLSLPHDPDIISDTLSELIGSSTMPLLESVYVYSDSAPCHILDRILMSDESAPLLKTLVLRHCSLDFTTPRFQSLCHLEVESPQTRISEFDFPSFCFALGQMHDLTTLKLSSALPLNSLVGSLDAMIENPIILSNLREVYISEICVPLSIFKCTRAPHLDYASFSLVCLFDHYDVRGIVDEIYEFAAFGSYATDADESTEFHLGITESKDYQVMNYTQSTGNSDNPFKTLAFRFTVLDSDDFWSNVPPIELVSSLSLHFEYNADVSDQVLEYITSLSQSDAITTLELPYDVLLGHELMGDLAYFPNLKALIFRSFPHRKETAIQLSVWLKLREARQLPRLQELNIEGWDKGIDSGISKLLRNEVDSLTTSRSDRSIEISLSRNFGEFD